MTESPGSLIARCLNGEQAAIRELVESHQGMVFGLCLRMLGQRQDAEDAAQETFLRALRSLPSFDLSRPFEPWLLAIAANRCRTALAARARRPSTTEYCEHIPDQQSGESAAKQLQEELNLGLQTLRPEHRRAFVLFHEMEMSYAEISEIMNCPIGTVKTWVHRARQELIARLQARDVAGYTGAVA